MKKEAVIPKTLKDILDEIHKSSLSQPNIHIRMFPLNREVSVHLSYGDISYITHDVDLRRAVSDLMEKLKSVNDYEFDPCALFLRWYGFEVCDPNIAMLVMDETYKRGAFRADTKG